MVRAFRLALWVLSTASVSTATLEARTDATERSILGKKVHKSDVIRVQDARLKRLEERVQKMRCGVQEMQCSRTNDTDELASRFGVLYHDWRGDRSIQDAFHNGSTALQRISWVVLQKASCSREVLR